MLTRMAGDPPMRCSAPGATANPASRTRVTADVSSATGNQTLIPLRPRAGTPRARSIPMSLVRRSS
jgi:hypothetical protein